MARQKRRSSDASEATATAQEEQKRDAKVSGELRHRKVAGSGPDGEATAGDGGATQKLVASSVAGASYLVLFIAAQRLVTFAFNQALVRSSRPEVVGFALVEMELLLSSVLFLAREGVRLGALRSTVGIESSDGGKGRGSGSSSSKRDETSRVVNMAWLPLPVSVLLTAAMGTFSYVRRQGDTGADVVEGALPAVLLYCAAAVLEVSTEPIFVLAQSHMMYGLRVSLEMVGVVLKCFVTYTAAVHLNLGAMSFGFGQLAFALTLFCGYYANFWSKTRSGAFRGSGMSSLSDLAPRRIAGTLQGQDGELAHWFDLTLFSVATAFMKQSFLKYLLTEGDKIMLTINSSRFEQGVYGVVSNYGSLAARLLFQPLEESSRNMFSKLLALDEQSSKPASKPTVSEPVKAATHIFFMLLKLVVLIGLIFLCFGTNYTFALVHLLLGAKWSGTAAPTVLAVYCVYVLALAMNGMTEALVYAVAKEEEISQLNKRMLVFFVGFILLSSVLLRVGGASGLVVALAAHMLARAASAWLFIVDYFAKKHRPMTITEALPPIEVLAAFGVCFVITAASRMLQGLSLIRHILVGATCFAAVIGVVIAKDRDYLVELRQLRRGK